MTYKEIMNNWFDDNWILHWENKYEFTYQQDMILVMRCSEEEYEILTNRLSKRLNEEELTIINKYIPDYTW